MAPYTAESARSTRAKPNAPAPAPVVPRIVPAIPLSFTRPAKPKQPTTSGETKLTKTPPEANEDDAQNRNPTDENSNEHERTAVVTGASLKDTGDAAPFKGREDGEGQAVTAGVTIEAENAQYLSAAGTDSPTIEPEPNQPSSQEPAQAPSQPAASSTQSQRPPVELPPPFYPSTDRSTPTSASSSTFARPLPPPNAVTMHHPRPSATNLVFGGFPDSSSTSPAPPVTNGHMPYPPPPPGFMGANFIPPPPPFQGHNHHFSEPHAGMMYPSMAVPPPGNFGFRRDQPHPPFRPGQQWIPPTGPPHQRLGGVESFSPQQGLTHSNGIHPLSRSASQASSPRIPIGEDLPAEADGVNMKHSVPPFFNGIQAKAPSIIPQDPEIGLGDYIRTRFSSLEFADYLVKLFQGEGGNLILALPVHGLIVARNPRLATLLASADSARFEGRMRIVDIFVADRFIDGHIFAEALKHLYGEELLNAGNFTHGLPPFPGYPSDAERLGSPQQRMKHALAYAAAGHFIQNRSIIARGLDSATELLRWDTVEIALSFAMDGGLDASWRVDDDKSSATSSDDTSSKFDTDSAPTYGMYSTQFLQTINGFLIQNFPADFELDSSAPHLQDMPRLPLLPEARPTSRNPRLSQIRFGQVPVEQTGTSRFVISLLSSILLSLPFPVLKILLEDFGLGGRLGRDRVARIAQTVIEEREARRRKIWKIQNMHPHAFERDEALKQNLLWTERVEPAHHALGFRLARSHQGIDTPASTLSNRSTERAI